MGRKRERVEILAVRRPYEPAGDVETIVAMAIHIVDENRDIWSQSWQEIADEGREARRAEARTVINALREYGYLIGKTSVDDSVDLEVVVAIMADAMYEADDDYKSENLKPHVIGWRREESHGAIRALKKNGYEIRRG